MPFYGESGDVNLNAEFLQERFDFQLISDLLSTDFILITETVYSKTELGFYFV